MKKCESCKESFEIIHSGSGGNNRKYCYTCYPNGLSKKERHNLRMALLRKRADEDKIQRGCKICGYNKSTVALEWHHHSDDKLENPSNLLKRSWEAYMAEVEKCILLCTNCHREVHAGVTKL
jgi:hypothetical protein